MKKLELKHLAPYLPYGLKVQFIGNLEDDYKRVNSDYIQIGEVAKLGSVEFRYTNPIYWMDFTRGYFGVNSANFKPILRPLSDLTKEIEHNGERFLPIDFFEIGDEVNESLEYDYGNIKLIKSLQSLSENGFCNDVNYFPYGVIQKLIEWHFDVFGLIDRGLAIDINTLK